MAVFLAALFAVSLFANGTPEQQRRFLEQLPLILQNQETSGVTVSSTASDADEPYSTARGFAIIDRDMATLTRLYKYLEQNYLWEIDYPAVYEAMATAMFETLNDKYTYYVTAEESEDYEEDATGQYGGLGFYLTKTYNEYQDPDDESTLYVNISQVFPNSPAAKGGILAGDFITHINGESVIEKTATECSKEIKGEVGTEVTVTIKRGSLVFDLTLKREKVSVPTVVSAMLENGTGYIQILQFYSQTQTAMEETLADLAEQGMTSLIIDLRNCPGGDVDATLNIADMFISDADLLNVNYKDSTKNMVYRAGKGTKVSPQLPVVVLINKNTASSAEILSSTLRDNGRATLIGTTSYGKGIMQAVSSFGDGDISVTIANFVPPSGNPIHQVGVIPDIEVPSTEVLEDETDAYMELYNSDEIASFIDQHPEYTRENVQLFIDTHPDTGLRPEVVQLLVRNRYYSRMLYTDQPVADVWFDPQIQRALKFLESGN